MMVIAACAFQLLYRSIGITLDQGALVFHDGDSDAVAIAEANKETEFLLRTGWRELRFQDPATANTFRVVRIRVNPIWRQKDSIHFHFAPANVCLEITNQLNDRFRAVAHQLSITCQRNSIVVAGTVVDQSTAENINAAIKTIPGGLPISNLLNVSSPTAVSTANLISEAQNDLDQGIYSEADRLSRIILMMDPNNKQAQTFIERARSAASGEKERRIR